MTPTRLIHETTTNFYNGGNGSWPFEEASAYPEPVPPWLGGTNKCWLITSPSTEWFTRSPKSVSNLASEMYFKMAFKGTPTTTQLYTLSLFQSSNTPTYAGCRIQASASTWGIIRVINTAGNMIASLDTTDTTEAWCTFDVWLRLLAGTGYVVSIIFIHNSIAYTISNALVSATLPADRKFAFGAYGSDTMRIDGARWKINTP